MCLVQFGISKIISSQHIFVLCQCGAAGGIMFLGSLCICPNIVNAIHWKYWTYFFTKLSILVHFGTRMNASSFGEAKVKLPRSQLGPKCCKLHLLALLTRYRTLLNWISWNFQHWCILGQGWSRFLLYFIFAVKRFCEPHGQRRSWTVW